MTNIINEGLMNVTSAFLVSILSLCLNFESDSLSATMCDGHSKNYFLCLPYVLCFTVFVSPDLDIFIGDCC